MKKFLIGSALALLSATAAQAAPTPSISFNTSASATNPANTNIIRTFDDQAVGTILGFNSSVTNSSAMGTAVRPAVFSSGNYAQAGENGSFTIGFSATNALSFALGSLDQYNQLTLTFQDLSTVVLTGGQIIGLTSVPTTGRDGVVTYSVTSGPFLTGVTFASAANAFEVDNIAVGVPEPAAWGMMILGFGLVGGVLRRRSPAKVKFA